MSDAATVRDWQAAIIRDCASILKRPLNRTESTFIISRSSFVALEMIHDHVRGLIGTPEALQSYLRSESDA